MITNQFTNIIYGVINGGIVPIGTLIIGSGGQLIISPSFPGGDTPISPHFDSQGNIQIFDTVNNVWLSLTAPNGILTLG